MVMWENLEMLDSKDQLGLQDHMEQLEFQASREPVEAKVPREIKDGQVWLVFWAMLEHRVMLAYLVHLVQLELMEIEVRVEIGRAHV